MWIHSSAWRRILLICVLAVVVSLRGWADERLRIAAMGGTRIATSAEDAGTFGNPASLVSVKGRTFALGLAAENVHWAELPKHGRVQLAVEANLDYSPSFYYSQTFGKWGASFGYAARSMNFANFTIDSTHAEYDRSGREFSATTDLFTTYDRQQDTEWGLGVSRALAGTRTGVRFKWLQQAVYKGTTVSTLALAARHGPEVDIAVPEELIGAIVEELQFGDRVRDILHEQRPVFERNVSGLEADIGFQREVWFGRGKGRSPLMVGVVFENLLRADLVVPPPFRCGVGVAYAPLEWLQVGADLWHDFGETGPNFAVGSELQKTWTGVIPKTVAFRVGAGREGALSHFSLGVGLRLGTAYLEYTMRFGEFTYPSNQYLCAFTLRF